MTRSFDMSSRPVASLYSPLLIARILERRACRRQPPFAIPFALYTS